MVIWGRQRGGNEPDLLVFGLMLTLGSYNQPLGWFSRGIPLIGEAMAYGSYRDAEKPPKPGKPGKVKPGFTKPTLPGLPKPPKPPKPTIYRPTTPMPPKARGGR